MLAEKQLKPELQSGKIFNLTETNINNVKIQPSSIDLTVKFIHIQAKKIQRNLIQLNLEKL